jgi:hypothetical protein
VVKMVDHPEVVKMVGLHPEVVKMVGLHPEVVAVVAVVGHPSHQKTP